MGYAQLELHDFYYFRAHARFSTNQYRKSYSFNCNATSHVGRQCYVAAIATRGKSITNAAAIEITCHDHSIIA